MMLGVFLSANPRDFKHLSKQKSVILLILLMQVLLVPFLGFCFVSLLQFFPQYDSLHLGILLVALCPGGIMSNYFTSRADGNVAVSSSLTLCSSMLSCITVPAGIFIFSHILGGVLQESVFLKILPLGLLTSFCIFLPLFLSVFLRSFFHQRVFLIVKICRAISLLLIAVIIIAALQDNWLVFKKHWLFYLPIIFCFNTLLLCIGYYGCKIFGFDHKIAKTAAFEIGIQNSTVALLILPLVAPESVETFHMVGLWGVWHLLSGMVLSNGFKYAEAM